MPILPPKMKILAALAKNSWTKLNLPSSALFHIKTRVCPKYFVHDRKYFSSGLLGDEKQRRYICTLKWYLNIG